MDFFGVWWYDLLMLLAILPQVIRFFIPTRLASEILSLVSIVLQLGAIVALPFIGCELTDVLIVLMIFATVTSGLAFLETRLGLAKEKSEDKEESAS